MNIQTHDVYGVPYSYGNRSTRRNIALRDGKKYLAYLKKKQADKMKMLSRKYKLPKELWEKGKSKFVDARLRADKKIHISSLYI